MSMGLYRAGLLAALLFLHVSALAGGQLLIVGGALKPGNDAVFKALIGSLPAEGDLVIIPAASGQPARSAAEFREHLARHGLERSRVQVFPLALVDDDSTEDFDESSWAGNAWDVARVGPLEGAAGFWMTGGDQMRLVRALRDEEGAESPLLMLMRARLEAGALVGGTSAGAAVMSEAMISGGDGFRSLLQAPVREAPKGEADDDGSLFLGRGLGLLPSGIVVDQHFDRRARLGRLVRALHEARSSLGLGVDENTALQVDLQSRRATVLGTGSVTVLDALGARFDFEGKRLVENIALHVLPQGAAFDLEARVVSFAPGAPTVGNEYYRQQPLNGGGMAFPNARLGEMLGFELLDNRHRVLSRMSFDEAGLMLVFTFSQTADSAGFWLQGADGDPYTVTGVRLAIERDSWRRGGD